MKNTDSFVAVDPLTVQRIADYLDFITVASVEDGYVLLRDCKLDNSRAAKLHAWLGRALGGRGSELEATIHVLGEVQDRNIALHRELAALRSRPGYEDQLLSQEGELVRKEQVAARCMAEANRLRERVSELERYATHTHGAVYEDGKLTDKCCRCPFDLRDPIHRRIAAAGDPIART